MNHLPVSGLNFQEIKDAFKEYLKGNPAYSDWNFEASGISTLINLLAYNTHYIGFYVKMLLDESFVDSAHTREALLSIAKRTGYIPKGKKAARAEVVLRVTLPLASDSPSQNYVIEAKKSNFSSVNSQSDRRTFSFIDDIILYDREENGSNVTYTSAPTIIYEGTLETYKFTVNPIELNQRFIIKDKNIDITTLKVDVEIDEVVEEYNLANDIFELDGQSKVFFVTTNEEGYYQVFFGNGVFGVNPPGGSIIHCNYISTNGISGNGARSFTFNLLGSPSSLSSTVETLSVSSGGLEPETIEELKFAIPHHYRRQNRAHTESDYRNILLSEFRNIDSLNVWGGEKNFQKSYGKVLVSIKPKYADVLTVSSKNEVRETILEKYGSVGADIQFVDPEFIEVDIEVVGKVNMRLTNESIRNIEAVVMQKIQEYNNEKLNKFDTLFSDVDLLDTLRETNQAITTIYSSKKLRKKINTLHGSTSINNIFFVNPINSGIISNTVIFNNAKCHIKDEDGKLFLLNGETKILERPIGSVDYEAGTISFSLPQSARVEGFEKERFGVLEFTVKPNLPDIMTSLNNIVRISKIKVKMLP